MKKYLTVFLIVALLLLSVFGIWGCPAVPDEPGYVPGTEMPSEAPGAVTKVKSKWSGGDLDFTQNDGTVILGLDGTNGDTEIASATITAGTATALTITTLTAPTVSGTTTINDLVSSNATLTGPAMSSPTITGTPVVANHVSGNTTMPANGAPTKVVTHGLGVTPVCIILTWGGDPGADDGIFATSANSTCFTISTTTANVTPSTLVYYLAFAEQE